MKNIPRTGSPRRTGTREALQPWLRRVAAGHAATRVAIGAALLVAPGVTRRWLGRDVDSGGGRVAVQAFAIREAVVGIGILRALQQRQPVRHWFALGTSFEIVDAAATLRQRSTLPDGAVPDAVALFALSGIAGGGAVALLLDE
jgi:hypothetical protein